MKNKIKVYLQYPWKFPDSPYYKSLLKYPSENVDYVNAKDQQVLITKKSKFILSNKLKANLRKIIGSLNLPLINAHLTKTDKKYDVIHCAHCLSLNKQPWVADFESSWQFILSGKRNNAGENAVRKLLLDKNCKKIMPWTEYTKKEILKIFPEKEIQKKIEVVYPAVLPMQKTSKKNKKPVVLYVARYFWLKGGIIALETLKRIKQKNDVEIIFISDAPEELKKKYPEITFLDLIPQEKVFEYYKKADIFFYPSFVDTFGFALLEAMAFGLPIVTINTQWTKTRPEIIKNNHNGLMFNVLGKINQKKIGKKEEQIIQELVKNTEKLIKNKKLREKISKNCQNFIKNGKFSIKQRNKKLKKIYQEALK